MYQMLLMINFMLRIFYHNFLKSGKDLEHSVIMMMMMVMDITY